MDFENEDSNDFMDKFEKYKAMREKEQGLYEVEENVNWKYSKEVVEKQLLPNFMDMHVVEYEDGYHFDFLNMVYDPKYNELKIKGEYVELNKNLKLKNKDARDTFQQLNDSGHNEKKIFSNFKKYISNLQKSNEYSIPDHIKYLIDTEKVSRTNNDLIQAMVDLFLKAGLKKTYNRYVMPLATNICRTIDKDEMLQFVYDVCEVNKVSAQTLDIVLTYFNRTVNPSYNKIVTKNGYFDFSTNKFHTSSDKEIIINKKTPYTYEKSLIGTEPPEPLRKFLYEIFRDDPENKIKQLLEIFGYYLDDGNPYQLIIFFIGASRSGKGVCASLLGELLDKNKCNVDIFNSDFDSKYIQPLIDANINIVDEYNGIKNVPEIKNYTGQGGMNIARIYEQSKHYEDWELPKTLVTTNDLAGIGEHIDSALMERMKCFIEFNFGISDPSKRDPQILPNIVCSEESMNWLLTNSIDAYMKIRHGPKGTRLSAEKTNDEFTHFINKYNNPERYIIEDTFRYDYYDWNTLLDDGEYEKLVTAQDVREAIYHKQPEAKIKDRNKVKRLIMDAFDLKDGSYNHSNNAEGYYQVHREYMPTANGNNKYFIMGLIKKEKE